MKKKIAIALTVIVALGAIAAGAAVAYGPAGPLGVSATSLADQMEQNGWGAEGKDKLSDVDCLRKTARTYACMGTYTPDKDSSSGDEDSFLSDPSSIAYEVVVGFDGMWIAEPTS